MMQMRNQPPATAASNRRRAVDRARVPIWRWFLPPRAPDPVERTANSILSGALAMIAALLGALLLLWPVMPLSRTGNIAFFASVVPLFVANVGLGLVFRRTGKRVLVARSFLFIVYLVLVGAAFVLGGPRSPTLIFFVCFPLLARTLLDRRAAYVWLGIVLASWTLLTVAEIAGMEFIQMQTVGDNTPFVLAVVFLCIQLVIFFVGDIYATTISRLSERLTQEAQRQHDLALLDPLTGIANRRGFFSAAEHRFAADPQRPRHCALLVADLNEFKEINDKLGHLTGDSALVYFAHCLRESVRHEDIVGRLGGDEFVVLLDGVRDAAGLERALSLIALKLEVPVPGTEPLKLRAAIGAALCPAHGAALEALLQAADTAMYQAKASGSFRCLYERGMRAPQAAGRRRQSPG